VQPNHRYYLTEVYHFALFFSFYSDFQFLYLYIPLNKIGYISEKENQASLFLFRSICTTFVPDLSKTP
jgi:hypothetical protein